MKILPGGLLVLGCLIWGGPVFAFRGPILNLRQLCSYAEMVVVAEVVEVESIEKKGVYDSIASLRVKKWIKGKDARTVLPVWFNSYGADPPSAEYPRWETVLAFLQKDPKHNGMYITTGGAEGHKSYRKNIEAYYEMFRNVAKERGFLLIDHYPNWKKLQKEDPEHFNALVPDTIHPTAAGCAEVVTPVVLKALGLDTGE